MQTQKWYHCNYCKTNQAMAKAPRTVSQLYYFLLPAERNKRTQLLLMKKKKNKLCRLSNTIHPLGFTLSFNSLPLSDLNVAWSAQISLATFWIHVIMH